MSILFQNERFLIREFKPEDMDNYLPLYEDEAVTRYLPKRTRAEQVKIFETALDNYAAKKVMGKWGIFDAVNGESMGSCLLRFYNDDPDRVEIGYAIRKQYWGKGIASDMAKAMVGYALANTTASAIVAVTIPENTGSQRVLEKAGLNRMPDFDRDGLELAFFKLERSDCLNSN